MTTPKPDMPEKCPTCSHSGLKCLNDNCNHILICGPCLAPTPPEIQDSSKCVCTHHKLIHESLPKHQYGPCRRCNCIGFSAPNSSETPNSSSKIIVTESKNFPFSSKSVKRPTKEEYFDSLPPQEQEEILKLRKVAQSVTKCDQLSDKGILNNSGKKILDACCAGRMFWFNKNHPDALYVDIRKEQHFETGPHRGVDNRHCAILPDKVMDFRKLDLADNSFSLVVLDPPHLKAGKKSYFAQIYGSLENTWEEDLRKGFAECFRVLKPDGVLIFKWNESDIPLRKILALTPVQPLFGHRSGKKAKTHWVTFMKPITP